MEGDAEFIPLIGKEEEANLLNSVVPDTLPILPVRNNVLFPGAVLPIMLARDKAVLLVKEANKGKKPIGVVAQKSDSKEDPKPDELYSVGTMAHIIKTLKMPDGSMMALIQGVRRFKVESIVAEEPYLQARVEAYDDKEESKDSSSRKALLGAIRDLHAQVVKLASKMAQESLFAVQNIDSADFLIYYIAAGSEMDLGEKQDLLEMQQLESRAMAVMASLNKSKQMLELKRRIENKVEADISKQQKEYFLTQQLKTIQEELGGSSEQEAQELVAKAQGKHWPEEVREHFDKEVRKLQRTHSMSPEYSTQFNYLNTLVELPWNEYTQDKDYLSRTAYPLLKGNAEFLLDYMAEDPNTGYLVTGPCISPENSFRYQGWELGASMMPTCDRVLAFEILSACLKASEVLDVDAAFADSLRRALAQFPPFRINSNGGICEWYEDYEEAHPNHRHTSHLLSFYPFSQITKEKDPELTAAVQKTIERRLAAEGWEDVEWSRANMVCFYARLKDAAKAEESLNILMTDFARENLLTISPEGIAGAPFAVFIFDGNAAGAAGLAEMLVQAHEGYVELLPCLPKEWKDGHFSGLCVKGGAEVSAEWKNMQVEKASLKATADNLFRLKVPAGREYAVRLNGKKIQANLDGDHCVVLYLKKGDIVELK